MADYTLLTRTNPFQNGIGGGTEYDKITAEWLYDTVALDKLGRCDRFQLLWSTTKRWGSSFGDLDPQRAIQIDYTNYGSHFNMIGQFYYTIPELLPGSAGKNTGSGTAPTDRGYLQISALYNTAGLYVTMEKVSIAGSHGQSSTYAGTLTTVGISDTSGNDVYETGNILLPSGATTGETYEIIIWGAAATTSDGYIQYAAVHAPAAVSTS